MPAKRAAGWLPAKLKSMTRSGQIEKIINLSLPMINFVFSDKISQNNFQNVAACIALRDLNLEFYKSESFLENHIIHEAQIFLCLVMPYVA